MTAARTLALAAALAAIQAWAPPAQAAASAPAAAASAPDCGAELGPAVRRVSQGPVTLAWVSLPQPLPLDRHFELDVVVCGAQPTGLRVDADMPAHRHGMNYRASVQQASLGRYRAAGLLFHMPGRWRLIFDLDLAGQRLRLSDPIELR
ncbi:MAG: hypothetical protein JNJ71_21385 [Rubrivivax sp.]|nr:hypothetical protein [Rubrivivax sp.]